MPKKQKNGLYRAKVRIGVAPDGKEIVKYAAGKTIKKLEQEKQEIVDYFIHGTGVEEDQIFGIYATQWYKLKKEPHLSESSRASYRAMLNKHILPIFGERNLRAIKPMEIQKWINGFAGKSPTTISDALNCIRNIMRSACTDGILVRDPTMNIVPPKSGVKVKRRALTEKETEAVLKVIDNHERGDLLATLYYLGVRRGEALGLKWGDFDWEDRMVHIQRDIDYMHKACNAEGALKTEAADRHIPIPNELYNILYYQRGFGNAYVFAGKDGRSLAKASFERIWISLMSDAGLVKPREGNKWKMKDPRAMWTSIITPHYLRHNYITKLWLAGVDPLVAMRLAGHSSYQVTANIYTHLQKEHVKRAAVNIEGVFSSHTLPGAQATR